MEAGTSLYDITFCSLDLETTGISPFSDRIIEIGIVKFRLDTPVVEKFCSLVNPEMPISEPAFMIHGISDNDVEDAPVFHEIADDVLEFLSDCVLVIQNPRFDLAFLEMEFSRSKKTFRKYVSFDTVIMSKKTYPELRNHKLQTVAESLGVIVNFHRALDDSVACMKIFKKIIRKIDPGRKMTFLKLRNFQGGIERAGIIAELKSREINGLHIQSGDEIEIVYRDNSNNVTERKVRVEKIYRRGKNNIIFGYCFLREEERYFNISRILEIKKP
ncbi:MAG: 3'-5' exoribonuclease [Spirochaetes bacterium]|nr:3'-5' exoribonuclease [Spirochaetota bacterium]